MQSLPAGVVFDMDGLLLDSERLAREAFFAACQAAELAVAVEVYDRCVGTNRATTAELLTAALGSAEHFERLNASWDALYLARVERGVPVKAGARELIEALLELDTPLGLATSTERPMATLKLERAGLLSAFSCLICGGETERGKPHPDPYLAAVTALGLAPADCWALEDSDNGVRAAHAAGLSVVQVPDLVPPGDDVLALGHPLANDLTEVLGRLRQLAGRRPT